MSPITFAPATTGSTTSRLMLLALRPFGMNALMGGAPAVTQAQADVTYEDTYETDEAQLGNVAPEVLIESTAAGALTKPGGRDLFLQTDHQSPLQRSKTNGSPVAQYLFKPLGWSLRLFHRLIADESGSWGAPMKKGGGSLEEDYESDIDESPPDGADADDRTSDILIALSSRGINGKDFAMLIHDNNRQTRTDQLLILVRALPHLSDEARQLLFNSLVIYNNRHQIKYDEFWQALYLIVETSPNQLRNKLRTSVLVMSFG